jgi:hypothetical protein
MRVEKLPLRRALTIASASDHELRFGNGVGWVGSCRSRGRLVSAAVQTFRTLACATAAILRAAKHASSGSLMRHRF